jgi:hypothetical protein
MTIGLFEAIKTTSLTFINNLTELFDQYGLKRNHYICQR